MTGRERIIKINSEEFARHNHVDMLSDPEDLRAAQAAYIHAWRAVGRDQRAEFVRQTREVVYGAGLLLQDESMPAGTREVPFVVGADILHQPHVDRIRSDLSQVTAAIQRVEDHIYSTEGSHLYERIVAGLPPGVGSQLGVFRAEPSNIADSLGRYDGFHCPGDGSYGSLELNINAPEGMFYHHLIQDTAVSQLGFLSGHEVPNRPDMIDHVLEAMIAFYRKKTGDAEGIPRIGIVLPPVPTAIKDIEMPRLAELMPKRARERWEVDLSVAVGRTFDVSTDGNNMYLDGWPIDVLWRQNGRGKVLPAKDEYPSQKGFLAVLNDDQFAVFNPPHSRLLGVKDIYALLYEYGELLTPDQQTAVARTIPFTVNPHYVSKLEVGGETMSLHEYGKRFRDQLILKPTDATHGSGVVFGVHDEDRWRETLEIAIGQGGYVMQRFISPPEREICVVDEDGEVRLEKFYVDTNFYITQGWPTSIIARAGALEHGPAATLNVAGENDGGLLPVLTDTEVLTHLDGV